MDFINRAAEAARQQADADARATVEQEEAVRRAVQGERRWYERTVQAVCRHAAKWMLSVTIDPKDTDISVTYIKKHESVHIPKVGLGSSAPVVSLSWRAVEHNFAADGVEQYLVGYVRMEIAGGSQGGTEWVPVPNLASIGMALALEGERQQAQARTL